MDKMTILGRDGRPKYVVTDIEEPKSACDCNVSAPVTVVISATNSDQEKTILVCEYCGGTIHPNPTEES